MTIEDGAYTGSGTRVRKNAHIGPDVHIEDDVRVGRGVVLDLEVNVAEGAVIGAGADIGTYQQIAGTVARRTVLPDLPPPVHEIVLGTGSHATSRQYDDGTYATSCDAYRHPASSEYDYVGLTGDGLYTIQPTGALSETEVYCDMQDSPDVGWTLVAKVNRVHVDTNIQEPNGWFGASGSAYNTFELRDPTSKDDRGLVASWGPNLLNPMFGDGLSQARFTMIAENDVNQRVTWYKSIVDGTFTAWISSTPHTATQVCTDQAMTQNCSVGNMQSDPGAATNFDGMVMSHHGYAGGVVHMRLNNDGSSSFDALFSSTLNNNGNAWNDTLASHWGNGLEVWVR